MLITILANRFEDGVWKDWEHSCNAEEAEGVIDSANAKAFDHGRIGRPVLIDYLEALDTCSTWPMAHPRIRGKGTLGCMGC